VLRAPSLPFPSPRAACCGCLPPSNPTHRAVLGHTSIVESQPRTHTHTHTHTHKPLDLTKFVSAMRTLVLGVAVSHCAAIGLPGPHVPRMTNRHALHGLRAKLVENIPGQLAGATQLNAGSTQLNAVGPLARWELRLLPAVPLPVVIWIQGQGLNKTVSDIGGTLNSYASGLNKTA
jgi:hypothetical protein